MKSRLLAARRFLLQCVAVFAMLLAVVGMTPAAAQTPADPKAGDAWLALMDKGQYGNAWDQSADLFKQAVTRDHWADQAAKVRGPLGTLVKRSFKSGTIDKDPPGAPSGDYMILSFDTSFAASPAARTETLSMFRSPDGTWRAVGYFIQ